MNKQDRSKDVQQSALVISRIFEAPREQVWKAWTKPEEVKHWWGPKYFTAPVVNIDFRVGGKYLFCMRSPDGQDFWSTGVYREIIPLERIVCTDSFADEKGNIVPATHYGLSSEFPLELLITLTFETVDGKTRLTLTHIGIPSGEARKLTADGWNTSLDKLADRLRSSFTLEGFAKLEAPKIIETNGHTPRFQNQNPNQDNATGKTFS